MNKIYKIFILFLALFIVAFNFIPNINASSEIIDVEIDGINITFEGSSSIYKRKNSILLSSDIYSLTYKNWIITDTSSIYDVDTYYVTFDSDNDNYTGNGSTLGNYDVTLKIYVTLKHLDTGNKVTLIKDHNITIFVVDNISPNFMYGNHYYYHFDNLPNGEELMWMLTYNQQLPFVNDLYIKYHSNSFDENLLPIEELSDGEYLIRFEYVSQSGYSGTGSCYIHLSNSLVNINSNSSDSIYLVIGVILIIGIVFVIFSNKKKKKGYKFK